MACNLNIRYGMASHPGLNDETDPQGDKAIDTHENV